MTDYRSDAERFVTEFIDYVNKHDIKDYFNKQTQRMERSPGVEMLIKKARSIFPERQAGPHKLTDEQLDEAIAAAPNVVDTRAQFSAKVAANGGLRGLVMALGTGDEEALHNLVEFVKAEQGIKEFHEPVPE